MQDLKSRLVWPLLNLYRHHPGQLLRSINKPFLGVYLFELKDNNQYIKVTNSPIYVLRGRADSRKPCNPALDVGDDEEIRRQTMQRYGGCVPPYWKPLQGIRRGLQDCNSSSQMKQIQGEIDRSYGDVIPYYTPPLC